LPDTAIGFDIVLKTKAGAGKEGVDCVKKLKSFKEK
jgi:hypothetical protein